MKSVEKCAISIVSFLNVSIFHLWFYCKVGRRRRRRRRRMIDQEAVNPFDLFIEDNIVFMHNNHNRIYWPECNSNVTPIKHNKPAKFSSKMSLTHVKIAVFSLTRVTTKESKSPNLRSSRYGNISFVVTSSCFTARLLMNNCAILIFSTKVILSMKSKCQRI